ncbi:acyl-CoA N-acyltransferase [Xylogone sp. PMI_703]|nr:acyl-CoA N-acyltransferase [Xylogone sp. PMI_703]
MRLTLRRGVPDDASTLTDIYLSAFTNDLISQRVFPRTPIVHKWWSDMLREELDDPHSHFICITDEDAQPAPLIIAFAKWVEPQDASSQPQELPQWPDGGDKDLANLFFGALMTTRPETMGERRHWYLELLATRLEYQGKGAGGKLIRWGLEKADEEDVETYLEGSPDGVPIYRRFGFEEVGRLSVVDGQFVEVFMLRPKQGGKK